MILIVTQFRVYFPGLKLLTIVGVGCLALIYFYFGFALFNAIAFREIWQKASYQKVSKRQILLGILGGIGLSLTLTGIGFKLFFWPGSGSLRFLGILLLIPAIAMYAASKPGNSMRGGNALVIRAVLIGGMAIGLFLVPDPILFKTLHIPEVEETPTEQSAVIHEVSREG